MIAFKKLTEKLNISDATDLHKELSSKYTYNKEDKRNIQKYTNDSHPLNNYHWLLHKGQLNDDEIDNNEISEFKQDTHNLDHVVKKHSTPHDMIVWSGLRHASNIRKGETYHHPAYLSTSISPKVAFDFGNAHKYETGNMYYNPEKNRSTYHSHVLKINIPKGHPGAYVGDHSEAPKEKEFILPRGTNLHIHNHIVKKYKDRNGLDRVRHIYEASPL